MSEATQPHGMLWRLRPLPGQEAAVRAQVANWQRGPGGLLPGTRLHLLLQATDGDGLTLLHLFESPSLYRRCVESPAHQEWLAGLTVLLAEPPTLEPISVAWNAAGDARSRVSVSIDRDVHAAVQDLIGRLIDRYPRTPAEDAYLNMLQSVADDYEQEWPLVMPEEEDPR